MKKNIEWLKSAIQQNLDFYNDKDEEWQMAKVRAYAKVLDLINQLDEPETLSIDKEQLIKSIENYNTLYDETVGDVVEGILETVKQLPEMEVLSQEWIDEHSETFREIEESMVPLDKQYIDKVKVQKILVPKQEDVDRAYKDGYEKGKQHTFYKGYLEGRADKESEPETVADVIADFYKSLERMKEVLSMEVEEMGK